nr:Ig domain-containing protein [uncultured Rhodoferax sp.]
MNQLLKILVLFSSVLSLIGCGGGGGGGGGGSSGSTVKLTVAVTFPVPSNLATIFQQTTLTPTFTGFDGHTPNCTVTGGIVPPGMTLNSNCTMSGIPTTDGDFNFSFRVGASGVSNTIELGATITVQKPQLIYQGRNLGLDYLVGDMANDTPFIQGWSPIGGVDTIWTYQIRNGALAPGLVLNTSSGTISGTYSGIGTYNATIQATTTTPSGVLTIETQYGSNVTVSNFGYTDTGGTGMANGNTVFMAYFSQPFAVSPRARGAGILSSFTLTGPSLPNGLTLNPNTGDISGVPTVLLAGLTNYTFSATSTSAGLSSTTSGSLPLKVTSPIEVSYAAVGVMPPIKVGSAVFFEPVVIAVSPLPVTATYSYAIRNDPIIDTPLPSGLVLNSVTGVISGTPTAAGSYICYVVVTINNNGISWNITVPFNGIVI